MNTYQVTWEMYIEADSPEEAAQEALDIQREFKSGATCFTCTDVATDISTEVDIEE